MSNAKAPYEALGRRGSFGGVSRVSGRDKAMSESINHDKEDELTINTGWFGECIRQELTERINREIRSNRIILGEDGKVSYE